MKLDIHERLALLEILPRQGDYAELQALRKAREILSFTQDEMDFYEMKRDDETKQWAWNGEKAAQRVLDAPMEQFVVETIRKVLKQMDENHTLTELFMSVYDKFIISYRIVE